MYLSELVLAGECGGSDFTSGLAGNALIGRVFDRLVDAGGTAIFEELCEGLGLKEYLAARAATPRVADDIRRGLRQNHGVLRQIRPTFLLPPEIWTAV